jgi:hypothetical protein
MRWRFGVLNSVEFPNHENCTLLIIEMENNSTISITDFKYLYLIIKNKLYIIIRVVNELNWFELCYHYIIIF